ncbi:MAG: Clp protease ATP binding subunit [Parcubacteria group bacterium Greene0714_4]|nr:MAG: Clp protease ATP binding subunit [Parcubacteria group bacterium Greene1014_15]TSD08447.1 MAG: Clp protease ATP binding subunit [Parcubacteria group bacterium Greene0714_4]
MLQEELQQIVSLYYPALLLDRAISHRARHFLKKLFAFFTVIPALFVIVSNVISLFPQQPFLAILSLLEQQFIGVAFISFSCWLLFFMFDAMYHSLYFYGLEKTTVTTKLGQDEVVPPQFELAAILFYTRHEDFVTGFCASPYGARILIRSGIDIASIGVFIEHRNPKIDFVAAQAPGPKIATLSQFASALVRIDKEFETFLLSHGVTLEDFRATAQWVERLIRRQKNAERWWSREHLLAHVGLGDAFAYGETYSVERYSRPISSETVFAHIDEDSPFGKESEEKLEAILAKESSANALLVGEAGVGQIDVVARLAKKIDRGHALPALARKNVFIFDFEGLISGTTDKQSFEKKFTAIMRQAISAGNVILLIEDLPACMQSGAAIGVDIIEVLDFYLGSTATQIIATSNLEEFHQHLENNGNVMKHFNMVLVEEAELETTLRVLEDRANDIEARNDVVLTYPAIKTIAESADQYFPYGVMPDKAVDLLLEIVPEMQQKGIVVIGKNHVLDIITVKTGIPVGAIGAEEKKKLENLEELMQKRVVDQNTAVAAVANALRRVRSGIGNLDRPVGSFLFLGPTGVGKTETAKALAATYFGDEDKLLRLDMSEYSGDDSLERLIGSVPNKRAGTLATLVRENPYGVLLLDEFEKATPDVHNLFLQIFDEGFFSDMYGKRVGMRNMILIATSNAGSSFIWEASKRGEKVSELKDQLVNMIIKDRIYRPELLNRFDDIVLFEPLGIESLRKIARIMLDKLYWKLQKKGITLQITDELVEVLVHEGYDPQFGARPMRRAMQQTIEEAIAKKIIAGTAQAGTTITLLPEELAKKN